MGRGEMNGEVELFFICFSLATSHPNRHHLIPSIKIWGPVSVLALWPPFGFVQRRLDRGRRMRSRSWFWWHPSWLVTVCCWLLLTSLSPADSSQWWEPGDKWGSLPFPAVLLFLFNGNFIKLFSVVPLECAMYFCQDPDWCRDMGRTKAMVSWEARKDFQKGLCDVYDCG